MWPSLFRTKLYSILYFLLVLVAVNSGLTNTSIIIHMLTKRTPHSTASYSCKKYTYYDDMLFVISYGSVLPTRQRCY